MIGNVFQIINFLIFFALIIYMVRKYLSPILREALVKQYRKLTSLHTEHTQLASEQKNLEKSIEDQEDEAMTLFKKINRWRNEVDLKRKAQKQDEEYLLEHTYEKARKQLKRYALHHTYKQVAPLVAKRLEQELKEKFVDDGEGHAYISKLLERL